MKENQLTIIAEDGTEELCEILFTHFDQEANKNYVVFQVLSNGECSAMEYVEADAEGGQLSPIETEEEWDMIEEMLAEYAEKLEDEEDDEEGCGCGDDCGCDDESEGHTCCGSCNH